MMGWWAGSDDAVIGWIREIALNASDPWSLAAFWAGLLGGTPVEWYPGWVTLEPPPHGQRLSFQGTGGGGGLEPGVHFDILVGDLDALSDGW
jgi:Glyoxalase-like domain